VKEALVIGRPETPARSPQEQFERAVQRGMEGPFLRYSKRLELMELAKSLGLNRFQANLFIAQVQQRVNGQAPLLADRYESAKVPGTQDADDHPRWRDKLILLGGLFIVAALVDMILVKFLFAGR